MLILLVPSFLPAKAIKADELNKAVSRSRNECVRIPEGVGGQSLLLDLSGVDSPTAAGLGELTTLHKRVQNSGGKLILCNVNDPTFETLDVARLTDVLNIRRSNTA